MTPEIASEIDALLLGAIEAGNTLEPHEWGVEVCGSENPWDYSHPLQDRFPPEDVLTRYRELRIAPLQTPEGFALPGEVPNSVLCLDRLMERLRRGEGDVLYPSGDWITGFECGPGKISVVAAPPGFGKTTLAMQYVFDVLDHDCEITAFVANAETSFDVLLGRELTRRSGVPAKALRFANLTERQMRAVECAASEIKPYVSRIEVMPGPFGLGDLRTWTEGRCGLLLLDYLQLFAPGDDARIGVNQLMRELRHLANRGWGILAVSAVTRGRGKSGSSYDSKQLTMASLKESGEIEFNADSIYLLREDGPVGEDDRVRKVDLHCGKNRHGERVSHDLVFNMPAMRFESPEQILEPHSELMEFGSDHSSDEAFSDDGTEYTEASF
ncbi:Replicative DNA helicase [Planctomycetes bacterium CA13]|uniref:Replicative DNA helicase n=1 Tax=Novipirellula herctigrandis TaxID=2527986 RepID=A0A5C5Z2M5_9BACT|nr:Replicative DNA helicase [Planctomycetes bacterium CA13]